MKTDQAMKTYKSSLRAIKAGKYETYTSSYVIQELEQAPEPKRANMFALIEDYQLNILNTSSKIRRLGELYIERGIIPASHLFDSLHVA